MTAPQPGRFEREMAEIGRRVVLWAADHPECSCRFPEGWNRSLVVYSTACEIRRLAHVAPSLAHQNGAHRAHSAAYNRRVRDAANGAPTPPEGEEPERKAKDAESEAQP